MKLIYSLISFNNLVYHTHNHVGISYSFYFVHIVSFDYAIEQSIQIVEKVYHLKEEFKVFINYDVR